VGRLADVREAPCRCVAGMSGLVWSEWPTRREASAGADAPGMVRLLSNEPTETERYGHAFALLALVARAEARERLLAPDEDGDR
jgi:hypothetical protein